MPAISTATAFRSRFRRVCPPSSLRLFLTAVSLSAPVFAQGDASAARIQELEERLTRQHRLMVDWGGLTHYGSDNSELKPPKPGENRVVFLGDQITEEWGAGNGAFFPGRPYLNRGIRGQTSPQMLVRFRQDVIALKAKVVVIQAGINDLMGATGPATDETIGENLASMTEIAKFNGIRVALASVTPICNCFNNHISLRLQEKISEANEWIKEYAERSHSVYLDYYSALVNGQDFKRELTSDGVLPNEAGYAVMAPLAEKAIAEALAARERKGVQ